jgi:hypothetical protein
MKALRTVKIVKAGELWREFERLKEGKNEIARDLFFAYIYSNF